MSFLSSYQYDELLRKAYRIATYSPDPSTQNGAVIFNDGGLISTGFNHFPTGTNVQYWHGDKEAKYARVVHAEMSAILNAARLGEATGKAIMVCPWASCSNCSKHIVAAGISTLVRHVDCNKGDVTGSNWHDDCLLGDDIMRSAGIEIVEIEPSVTSYQLRRNGKIWPSNG